jgi:uncharacterized membrane protein YqaE (UPF0057 family)
MSHDITMYFPNPLKHLSNTSNTDQPPPVPPIGAFAVAGCGPDLLINLILTLLGWIPGHLHAFYMIYAYYDRRGKRHRGEWIGSDAFGIFSRNVQTGGAEY